MQGCRSFASHLPLTPFIGRSVAFLPKIQFLLENLKQMLLQRAGLDEIVDADRVF